MSRPVTIVVHGGAGTFGPERIDAAKAGCEAAVSAGLGLLQSSASAVDAVIAAVRFLEDDPTFNAGIGSVLTRAGTVEVDAAIMCGASMHFGGIGAVSGIRRPIELARSIMNDGEHVLLTGSGARDFAMEHGVELCDGDVLTTERARRRLEIERARRKDGGRPVSDPEDPGTVGACAIDAAGNVAAATSTGGITFKRPGRVGDTPLCGCGTYADNRGGSASATGHGESIARVAMASLCVRAMASGASASDAAWAAVRELGDRVGGEGGIICVDARGRLGIAHNSPSIAWGAASLDSPGIASGMTREPGTTLWQ